MPSLNRSDRPALHSAFELPSLSRSIYRYSTGHAALELHSYGTQFSVESNAALAAWHSPARTMPPGDVDIRSNAGSPLKAASPVSKVREDEGRTRYGTNPASRAILISQPNPLPSRSSHSLDAVPIRRFDSGQRYPHSTGSNSKRVNKKPNSDTRPPNLSIDTAVNIQELNARGAAMTSILASTDSSSSK